MFFNNVEEISLVGGCRLSHNLVVESSLAHSEKNVLNSVTLLQSDECMSSPVRPFLSQTLSFNNSTFQVRLQVSPRSFAIKFLLDHLSSRLTSTTDVKDQMFSLTVSNLRLWDGKGNCVTTRRYVIHCS